MLWYLLLYCRILCGKHLIYDDLMNDDRMPRSSIELSPTEPARSIVVVAFQTSGLPGRISGDAERVERSAVNRVSGRDANRSLQHNAAGASLQRDQQGSSGFFSPSAAAAASSSSDQRRASQLLASLCNPVLPHWHSRTEVVLRMIAMRWLI